MDVKTKLIKILNGSKVNHQEEIMKERNLKNAHLYCKLNDLSGSVSGSLIENYIRQKHDMIKNKVSLCIGDAKHNNINLEIKHSNGGKNHNKFNFVQLRLNHTCDYLLTAYYLCFGNVEGFGELFLFKLTKEELKKVILKYGTYAHGTTNKLGKITKESLDDKNNQKEYALRPKYEDGCWNMLLNFRIQEYSI